MRQRQPFVDCFPLLYFFLFSLPVAFFPSLMKSASGQGVVIIFRNIYAPEQEAPPAEEYNFLLLPFKVLF